MKRAKSVMTTPPRDHPYEKEMRAHPMLWWMQRRWRNAALLRAHVKTSHQWAEGFADTISDDAVRVTHWREHQGERAKYQTHSHRRTRPDPEGAPDARD